MTSIGPRLSTWVEIRVPHEFLNGSDIMPALRQMGCERMAKSMATSHFGKAGAFNGLLHSLLDHAWLQLVAAFFPRGVLPAVLPGKDPLAARSQILLKDQANVLELPFQSLALACGQQKPTPLEQSHHQGWISLQFSPHDSYLGLAQHHRQPPPQPCPDHPFQVKITFQQLQIKPDQERAPQSVPGFSWSSSPEDPSPDG